MGSRNRPSARHAAQRPPRSAAAKLRLSSAIGLVVVTAAILTFPPTVSPEADVTRHPFPVAHAVDAARSTDLGGRAVEVEQAPVDSKTPTAKPSRPSTSSTTPTSQPRVTQHTTTTPTHHGAPPSLCERTVNAQPMFTAEDEAEGWSVICGDVLPGSDAPLGANVIAETIPRTRTIILSPSQPSDQILHSLAHESVHAHDLDTFTNPARAWLVGVLGSGGWWSGDAYDNLGAERFAESAAFCAGYGHYNSIRLIPCSLVPEVEAIAANDPINSTVAAVLNGYWCTSSRIAVGRDQAGPGTGCHPVLPTSVPPTKQ